MNALTELRPAEALQSRAETRRAVWWGGVASAGLWGGVAALILLWPDADDLGRTDLLGGLAAGLAAVLLGVALAAPFRAVAPGLRYAGPWLAVLALGLGGWELVSAKLDLLSRPFFAAPQSMLEVLTDDWPRLGESLLRSLWLLLPAYLLGAAAGFLTGVAVGWSRIVG